MVRSPTSYFDVTPSGQLISRFSNDLGILDTALGFIFIDVMEGPFISIVMAINIFSIDPFFIIPGSINIVFIIAFFLYCKNTIVESKQLDLRVKSPMFNHLN